MITLLLIYITISTRFASAIRSQFEQSPGTTLCVDDETDLAGFLHETRHTLFELVIMPSGLDTDLKDIWDLACLFIPKLALLTVSVHCEPLKKSA